MIRLHATRAIVAAVVATAAVTSPALSQSPAGKVQITQSDGKAVVTVDGQLFTEYVFAGHAKPILYPIIGPHDVRMTRDYPMKEGVDNEASDHPHHKSLWYTHDSVNGVRFWMEYPGKNSDLRPGKIVQTSLEINGTSIRTQDEWRSPDDDVVCSDSRVITFGASSTSRYIDFEITLRATHGDVTFGDTKEGTMGIRTNPLLRLQSDEKRGNHTAKGQAINSEGVEGRDIWGKRAKWVDYWAPINDQTVGIAIFDHPSNPRHPTWWHARYYGLVAANPFGIHDFEKKPEGAGDFKIPAGESVTFRYRFLFHEGDYKTAGIADEFDRFSATPSAKLIKVGIIGLDTSHAIAFTKLLNDKNAPPELANCRVIAAYPKGSPDIESSTSRVPKYTEEIQKLGVNIVPSIDELLTQVDCVLLETNDGRPHLEQVRPVLRAGKPVFIDKPIAGSLADAVAIFREAEQAGVPLFSSSSLRYGANSQAARAGKFGRITHCETHSPASLEPTHPDLFWYGIHGCESLFTVMGTGCQTVQRSSEDGKIVVTGKWDDGRVGIFREGKGYGGHAKGDKGEGDVGSYDTYRPLVVEIVKFFRTGIAPIDPAETLELYAFMEAADESKRREGAEVKLADVLRKAQGFEPLFNGKDLTGWKGLVGNPKTRRDMPPEELEKAQKTADEEMRAHWSVVDGVLQFDGKGKSLCTAKDYGDFELYLDWKILEGGDSGVYLRGSPQVQIWDTEFENYFRHGAENGSGSLWNNQKHQRFPFVKADKPVEQWNTFHITMIGEKVTIELNDQLVFDDILENYWERGLPIYPHGQIELQNHGNTLFFRNLWIREIQADEANATLAAREQDGFRYESIFNGRDFTGWTGPVENYEVVDGAIQCKKGKGGTIFTDKEYSDFIALLEFKTPVGGNNGLAIRYPGTGAPHIDGFCELQVLDTGYKNHDKLDPRQYHGSVYGMVGAHSGYLRPAGEWNFQKVTVKGSNISVELNGTTILDADVSKVTESKDGKVPPGVKRTSGHFGFAGHNDPVSFRNISIRELPGEPAVAPSRDHAIKPKSKIRLFNGRNLEGFYTWTRDTTYSDTKKNFTVKDGMIHVLGDGYGGLITNNAYRDYHLTVEFKWGEKTWGNRVDCARDSGLLVHCWGPNGGYSNTWMASIEAQIIEGGVGDILVLSGTDPVTGQVYPTSLTAEITRDRDGEMVWKKGGERTTVSRGRINWFGRDVDWADKIGFRGKDDVESEHGEWTTMEVIADGSHLLYKVNGVVVNEAFDASPSAGKILLQTEQAELFVRRLELQPLEQSPAK